MNNEIISKSNVGSNIPFADEDVINVDGGASRLVTSWITSRELTNAEEDTCSRNVQNFTTFRASGLLAIARRDLPSDDDKMLNHRRELSQQHYARQSSAPKTDQSEEIEGASSGFENVVIKYQQSKLRPKRQINRELQQQQQQSNYSSSDESVARNKSKSTSSIDTQSVNNILDEYEDLDYRRSSDLSDVGNISVTNFEAIMMDQQKRQQIKSKQKSSTKIQTKAIPTRENIQPVLKVNQQTQVRQRSRDRQKDSNKGLQQDTCVSSPITLETIESGRSKMPEILLRKGEVQKRVDEWLNQAHSQNFPMTPREKPLTRSNSSAEQKSQRRYRGQDSRSSIDEARDRLSGGTSSSYDDLTHVNRRLERGRPEKMNVSVNASRDTYKEYLAVRSKQQDYGFNAQLCAASSRSGDSNLASRIPQRGLLSSSFKSRRVEADLEEKTTAASRINLTKAMSESNHGSRTTVKSNSKMIEMFTDTTSMATTTTTTSAIISCKRPSLKRPGNGVDENCAAVTYSLVKEEMDPSCEPGRSKGLSLPGGSLSDQGESISPNKDGESRRPTATASGPTLRPATADKTIEVACKSTEASTRCAANYLPRGSSSRITSSVESDRVIATESPRRRLQFCSDFRRELRSIDQSRQEQPIYGSAVSARVRALQGQVELRTSKSRCHQVAGASMEVRRPPILPRRDLGVSPSRDAGSQDRTKISIGMPSSNFKSDNRAYATINDSHQQPNEQNATRSKIAATENVPSVKVMRYASPNHVEKIYERSLQPQVIHTDNLESIFRPSLQASSYSEKVGVSKLDRESTVKETSTFEDETFDKIGKSRHEHLETIEEDDRKSEGSVCRYPEIGLKQCLKVQKSLPNGRSKESTDKRKDNPIYVKWNQQQHNESAKTFASFQSTSICQSNVKSSIRSRSPEIKESRGQEDTRQDPDESTTILQDLVGGYEDASQEDQDQLTIHSRENSNLSTATIPMDELESQGGSRLKTEEDSSRNKLQFGEKLQDRVIEETMKNADERGAVVNEILVKNLQFEQDLPENPVEQMRSDHVVQQVNFHNILCDNYENEKLKNKKMYMTNEEMEHRRLIDMLKRGNFETLKTRHVTVLENTKSPNISLYPYNSDYRKARSRRTPTTSTGIGSSITDEIWTSANERRFCRTSTTSTGIGSSLNLHENNRSLESRDGDFYSTDIEDSKDTSYRRFYPTTPTTSGLGSSSDHQSVETQCGSRDLPDHLWAAAMEDGFSRFNAMKSLQTITRQPRPNHDWVKTERISRFTKHRTISQSPQREQEIWTSKLNESAVVSGYATQRNLGPHKCHHQARRSFSTSIVADLAVTPEGSQQSLGSGEFLELERSYTLSTPGGSSPVCCPPCSPPPAPAAYISSARASSRRLGAGSGLGGPTSPERDPLGRLLRFLKTFYRELGTRDPPHLPPWASPLPLGTLCPAHFQPHLQLVHKSEQEHRLENIKPDQIFAPVRLSDGTVSEAPRRVAVEGGPGSGRTTLCLRLLHQWASQSDGPALAFIVPLRELRGSPVLNYLARELFPRTAALGDAVSQVWRTLHLMEDRVLFVLDGYDECVGGRASLGDAADLLEGRLFPDARILVTCSPNNSTALAPLVQRRIHLAGLEWSHVERLCVAYFIHNDIAEKACEFLEALNVQPQSVRQLGQHPLGWIMLCCLYQDSGSLPTETSALVQAAVKCIVKRSLDPPVPYNEEIPGHCRKRLEDFGKVSLAALREGRCCYTEAELRARGGGIEITRLGFLSRGLTFGQRRKPDLYTPIHMAVAEFLAAYYLTSVAQYANILRRELEGLPSGIIGHLAGLLGSKTHLILNQLCPLEVPPRAVFSLLKAAGASDGNISAVCRLVGAGPGFGPAPNERPPAPLVHTSPLELEGWARILESPACTLEALEVVFQVERGSDPRYLDDFFDALASNESVKLVRITSLLGQEFPADEAQRLAGHLKSVLGKKKLNDFELVITCLEEAAHDRLECVVNALCRGLSHASSSLSRLVLDMNLSGEQVSRVCEALRDCIQVQALHLPHLGCGCEGLASVAELLKERPLLALNLAGSWGAKNEDPSSSGISMGSGSGSGSGSSGCASSTLGTLPLNRCYSSLPRGALTAYGSLTRPATLPRLPLGLGLGPAPNTGNGPLPQNDRDRDSNGSSKRNSDSVLCHRLPLLHPLPTCDVASHQGTGFHEIFNAIREPNCKLRSLNVSKCLLGGLDAGCLGETIRKARNLDALRAAGASRPADVMPLVLALTEAPCLQLLDLSSPRLALDDHPSRLLCHALARNTTLKLLSLEGWTFRIEESDSLAVFSELLRYTSVRELSLCNARLHLAVHEGPLARLGRRDDAGAELLRAAPPPACPAIVFLRLAGFQVTVNDRLALRGPLLLPFLAGFTSLSELDLSLDKSTIGGSSGSLLFIDDKILQQFFSCLAAYFRSLQSLRINFWRVTLEDSDRTMRQIAKHLKLCGLSFLRANGLIVTDSAKRVQMEHVFVQAILTHLQCLTWLCLDGVELTETQATSVGKCVRDRYPGTTLEISAKDVHVRSVKALVTAAEEGGRTEVVYTGGSSCRLKITKLQKGGRGKKK